MEIEESHRSIGKMKEWLKDRQTVLPDPREVFKGSSKELLEKYFELRVLIDRFICEMVDLSFDFEGTKGKPFSYQFRGTRFHKPYEKRDHFVLPKVKEVLPYHAGKQRKMNNNENQNQKIG